MSCAGYVIISTEDCTKTVEITTTQVVNIITEGPIGATGPAGADGPPGPSALPNEVRVDTDTAGTIYVGQAVSGSSESAAVWTIVRTIYNTSGVRTSLGTASNVNWTGRTSHIYV